ncbi:MAG: hypothetical protein IT454_04910 [Planctomycetes bacterium]|nr:hypothetical protein [Planctomycetota bacterium]
MRRSSALAPLAVIALALALRAQNVWHVRSDALPGGDGSSWSSAFDSLDSALSAARASVAQDEIRIARGRYRPATRTNPADPRSATFLVPSGTKLQGGWNPFTNAPPPAGLAVATQLDGGLGSVGAAYHVVTIEMFNQPTDPRAELANLTVTHGRANGVASGDVDGGGVYLPAATSSVRLDTCLVVGNSAARDGGGLYAYCINVQLKWSRFADNQAGGSGGGAWVKASTFLSGTSFARNSATDGGGYVGLKPFIPTTAGTVHLRINGCRFKANEATNLGGAMHFPGTGINNAANYRILNCTFSDNQAGVAGGALSGPLGGVGWIINSILWGDSAPLDSELTLGIPVDYSIVDGPGVYPGSVGATNMNFDPLLNGDQSLASNTSPAIDASSGLFTPQDILDLDGDGITAEPLPLDMARAPRLVGNAMDLGAYEHP